MPRRWARRGRRGLQGHVDAVRPGRGLAGFDRRRAAGDVQGIGSNRVDPRQGDAVVPLHRGVSRQAGRGGVVRHCRNLLCRHSLAHRGPAALFCEDCAAVRRSHMNGRGLRRRRRREVRIRRCIHCGADIAALHHIAKQCLVCAKKRDFQVRVDSVRKARAEGALTSTSNARPESVGINATLSGSAPKSPGTEPRTGITSGNEVADIGRTIPKSSAPKS